VKQKIPQLRKFAAVSKVTGQVIPGMRLKPPQATILRRTTVRQLAYLERHGLASFAGCNLTVAMPVRVLDPETGVKLTLNLPTGGV
jgi:hypothetical protein